MGLLFSYEASQRYRVKLAQASLFRDTAAQVSNVPIRLFLIFFSSEVDKRTFVIGDKIVKSTPDLAYCTRQVVVGDNIDDTKTLLFVVEVFISN